MKNIVKFLYVSAIASLMAVACDIAPLDGEKYQPGEPDLANCAGVYFPEQESAGSHILDPADPTTLTFTVKRNPENKSILTVPVKVTCNDEEVIRLTPIIFDAGAEETTFTANFPDAEVGVTYTCTVEVYGDEFVSKYSSNATSISFSVLREKWTDLGMATYTDDYMTAWYNTGNPSWKVKVLENDLKKGVYRFVDMWEGFPYLSSLGGRIEKGVYIEIDASNPNRIILEDQFTGLITEEDGEYWIWSMAGYAKKAGSDPSEYYGKMENGIITFPVKSLLLHSTLYNPTSLYYANGSGMFKIKLPGAVEYDFTLELSAGLSEDGELPVTFSLGPDLAKVAYAVAEGVLDEDGIAELEEKMLAGEVAVAEITEAGVYNIEAEKTGKYTLVAIGFDATGTPQKDASVSFGYVAKGEEVPVVVNCGLETTSKWEPRGYDATNSLEYSICGEDLTGIKYGLYKTATVDKYGMDAIVADVEANGDDLSEDDLEVANTGVFSDLFIGLLANTPYTFVVVATNGFESKAVSAECATDGLPMQLLGTGTYYYNGWWTGKDPGLEMYFNPNDGTYFIPNMFSGINFVFNIDEKGIITFPYLHVDTTQGIAILAFNNPDFWDEATIAMYYQYGSLTDEDVLTIADPSYVDENGVLNFHMTYYANGYGAQVWNWEAFVLDAEEAPASVSTKLPGTLAKRFVGAPVYKMESYHSAGLKCTPALKTVSVKVSRVSPSTGLKAGREAGILK